MEAQTVLMGIMPYTYILAACVLYVLVPTVMCLRLLAATAVM